MPTNFLWGTRGTVVPLLTSELNTLAIGAAAYGSEIDNTTTKWQLCDLELILAANNLSFTTASIVRVHFVTTGDGTQYPKVTAGASGTYKLPTLNYFARNIQIYPSAFSSEVTCEVVRRVEVPSGKFKTFLINDSGSAWPASGNTLKLYPTPEQY